jgi:peptidyl-prolyl cis-trans isomerase SurA
MTCPVRKLILASVFYLFALSAVSAQSLFTVDGKSVSKEDFLKAYNKNNIGEKPSEKSYRDYLDLYIRYKLKVRAAYDAQLDTLPGQQVELQNFRSQVAETYLKDDESLDKLVKESFSRGQEDIHLAHIFIVLTKDASPADTAAAFEKAMATYSALKAGKNFGETARAYSDDPSVKSNGGDIGYITVFTLPYGLENLAYSLKPGQVSKPYRSKAGYHIFKNLGTRKSLGRMKAAQILVPFPPKTTEEGRLASRLKADSIYQRLRQGAGFSEQAKLYSGDNLSYQNGGELPEFGIGKYDSSFETAAFGLSKDGAISQPIATPFGYHIIKRIARKPFPRTFDKESALLLKQEVMNDPRIEISRKALLTRILQQTGFTLSAISETDLWAFADSLILNRALHSHNNIYPATVLFTLGSQPYPAKGWLDYAVTAKSARAGGVAKTDKELFDIYLNKTALEYYRNHLEDYNKDFAFQLTEFKEGNLLFEIMQRKIWDKASTDSGGLHKYFEAHKDKYWWENSADALLFTCNNQKTAEDLKRKLDGRYSSEWRKKADSAGASVQADSGRYELAQIPSLSPGTKSLTAGQFTDFVTNKTDNTVSFSYILQVYPIRSPRNYRDSRGFVINDYQTWLEDQWIDELKKKYPVKLDETVFGSLPKE